MNVPPHKLTLMSNGEIKTKRTDKSEEEHLNQN